MHVAFSSGATKSSVSSRQLLQRAWCWGRCQELPAVGRYSVRACVWHTARAHGVAARAHLRPPQPTLLWTPSTPRHQPTHSTPRVNTMARRTQLALAVLLLLAVRATTAHGRFLRQEGESPSPSPSPEAAAAASPSPSPDMAASTESPSPSQDAATTAASPSPEMAETTDAAASPAPEPAPAPAPAAAGNASSTFESVEAALAAAANTPLATFVAAVKAAGACVGHRRPTCAWMPFWSRRLPAPLHTLPLPSSCMPCTRTAMRSALPAAQAPQWCAHDTRQPTAPRPHTPSHEARVSRAHRPGCLVQPQHDVDHPGSHRCAVRVCACVCVCACVRVCVCACVC
jgi:hypothetical protein